MSIRRIKKGDTVIAVAGSSVGKTGKVLAVDAERGRALVEGLNVIKKAMRKSQDDPQGGIVEREAPITLSNLMPYCPKCEKGVRVSRKKEADKSLRQCKACGQTLDG